MILHTTLHHYYWSDNTNASSVLNSNINTNVMLLNVYVSANDHGQSK